MKPRPFSPLEDYAYQCGRAGLTRHAAETLATLARALRRHSVNGCNRPVTPQEERADARNRAAALAYSCPLYTIRIDDSALTTVYVDALDTGCSGTLTPIVAFTIFVPPVLT